MPASKVVISQHVTQRSANSPSRRSSRRCKMPEIVVIGAGLTGLTCTYQLQKAGKDVILLEESGNAGGKIGTERVGGYLLEAGPNSLRLDNAETRELIDSLG